MDLATITMDKAAAREAFLAYRRAVRARHDAEDAQIMRGYRALAQGHQLIRLADTLAAGGESTVTIRPRWGEPFVVRVPRLAACRADAKIAHTIGIRSDGSLLITADRRDYELAANNQRDRTRLAAGTFPRATTDATRALRAIVPTVPPPLRPAHKLSGYTLLWEAEWRLDPQPPIDPALLRHIGGDLYAVVAIWDLTDIERAVLAARRDS